MLRDWILLGRPHLAGLSISGTLLGAVAAGGTSTEIMAFLIMFALVFHWVGHAHNSACDYAIDKLDPTKANNPLVRGTVNVREAYGASMAVIALLGSLGYLATLAADARSPQVETTTALAFLLAAMIFGWVYNEMGKRNWWGGAYFALGSAALPGYVYLLAGGHTSDRNLWLLVAYTFAYILAQSFIGGSVKDATSERGFLHRFGFHARHITDDVYEYAGTRKSLLAAAVVTLIPFSIGSLSLRPWPLDLFSASYLFLSVAFLLTVGLGSYYTESRGRVMIVHYVAQFAGFAALPLLLHLPPWWTAALVLGPAAWFVASSLVVWGSWRPRPLLQPARND